MSFPSLFVVFCHFFSQKKKCLQHCSTDDSSLLLSITDKVHDRMMEMYMTSISNIFYI